MRGKESLFSKPDPIRRWFGAAVLAAALLLSPRAFAGYASIVIDADSGEVLHAANANTRNYPASLTKIMTLYMTFEALAQKKVTLSDRVVFSEHAANQAPSKLGLRPGQSITVEQAILALVTKSANDVAVALAEKIAGHEAEFARRMTVKARQLGMSRTTFRNASGLPDPEQQSTAKDMATLARATIRNYPRYYGYYATKHFRLNGQTIATHNRLMLRYKGADGIKTGYIRASGFNLVSSAQRNGRRVIGVVFGGITATQRDQHMANLLDRAFQRRTGGETMVAAASIEELIEENDPDPEPDDISDAEEKAGPAGPAAPVVETPRRTVALKAEPKKSVKQLAKTDARARETTAKGDGSWGIQVGAFSQSAKALQAAGEAHKRLASALPGAKVHIVPWRDKGKVMYRARVTGLTESQAKNGCKRLATTKTNCRLVAPEGNVKMAQLGN